MIDTLVRVIDRLIQLEEHTERRVGALYREIVRPSYEELLAVHRDCLPHFGRAWQMLPSIEFLVSPGVARRGDYDFAIFDDEETTEGFSRAEVLASR